MSFAALGSVGAVAGLFYNGNIRCNKDINACPIVPIVNLSQDQQTSMSVAVMTVALFGLVFLTCCHIFLIALQKLRVGCFAQNYTFTQFHGIFFSPLLFVFFSLFIKGQYSSTSSCQQPKRHLQTITD